MVNRFLNVFGPRSFLWNIQNIHTSISKIRPTTGFRIMQNRKKLPCLDHRSIAEWVYTFERESNSTSVLPRILTPIYQAQTADALHDNSHQASTKEIWGIASKMTSHSVNGVIPSFLMPNQFMPRFLPHSSLVLALAVSKQTRMRNSLVGNMTPCR